MDWFWKSQFNNKNYLMHKGLFCLMSLLVLLTLIYTLISTSYSNEVHPYLECKSSSKCINQLFNSPDCGSKIPLDSAFCTQEFLLPGESLGVSPPFIYNYFWFFVIFEMTSVLLLNHFLFNKGFFKGLVIE